MLKQVYAINAGRPTGNTAKFLKKALEGAKAQGAKTEFINLHDIQYNGCCACFTCKKRTLSGLPKKCYHQDALTPILEKIAKADGLLIGSPVYFWRACANFRAFSERFLFPRFSYEKFKILTPKQYKIGLIFTMGADTEALKQYKTPEDLISFRNYYSELGPIKDLWVKHTPHLKHYERYEFPKEIKNFDPPYISELDQAFTIGKFVAE